MTRFTVCLRPKAASHHLSRCYGCLPQEDIAVVRAKVIGSRKQPCQFTLAPSLSPFHQQKQLCALTSKEDTTRQPSGDRVLVKILLRLHQKTMGGIKQSTDRGQMLPKKFTSEDVKVAPLEVMKLIRCQCHDFDD